MTLRSSMNLRILKSNKDEAAYRKRNQGTSMHLPSYQLPKQEEKKITLSFDKF